jgi:formamidopyrimidine-DNA glycosylase
MPELPEVETLRRALEAAIVGRSIASFVVRLPKVFRAAEGLSAGDVVGTRIVALSRRGKYLVFELSDGLSLVFHLRLAGQFVLRCDGETVVAGGHPVPKYDAPLPHKATHIEIGLDDGRHLYFTDIRQFGFCLLMPAAAVTEYLAAQRLGPEALGDEFTVETLAALLARRKTAVLKALLLDQRGIAGLGNIYADESLWHAGIDPLRLAGSLSPEEIDRLYRGIRETLSFAVTHGVAEMRGDKAINAEGFPFVHGRAGKPCPRCGGTIQRVRVGGRSTYFCETCQR